VRKDLVRQFSRQFPVPTYVVEFLLGRYCATTDEEEINEGLEIVQRQLLAHGQGRRAGAVQGPGPRGGHGQADRPGQRPPGCQDRLLPRQPAESAAQGRADRPEMVREHERLLTGGFYAEVTLSYDSSPSLRRRMGGPSASRRCVRSSSPSAMCSMC
jgi:ATP-dependent Lon protease